MGLPPDDGPNPRLGQTDDAPRDTVGPGLKHDPLLLVDGGDYIQAFCLLWGQFCTFLNQFSYITYVPADILQLFAHR